MKNEKIDYSKYFIGEKDSQDKKSIHSISLGNIEFFNDEKIDGYFLEELIYKTLPNRVLVRESISIVESEDIYYVISINDSDNRETFEVFKEDLIENTSSKSEEIERLAILINSLLNEDTFLIYYQLNLEENILKMKIDDNSFLEEEDLIDGNGWKDIDITTINVLYFKSKLNVFNSAIVKILPEIALTILSVSASVLIVYFINPKIEEYFLNKNKNTLNELKIKEFSLRKKEATILNQQKALLKYSKREDLYQKMNKKEFVLGIKEVFLNSKESLK
jgi:hypothetical protein